MNYIYEWSRIRLLWKLSRLWSVKCYCLHEVVLKIFCDSWIYLKCKPHHEQLKLQQSLSSWFIIFIQYSKIISRNISFLIFLYVCVSHHPRDRCISCTTRINILLCWNSVSLFHWRFCREGQIRVSTKSGQMWHAYGMFTGLQYRSV